MDQKRSYCYDVIMHLLIDSFSTYWAFETAKVTVPSVTPPEFSNKCLELTLEEFRVVFERKSSSLALTLFVYSLIDRPTAEEAKKWQTSFESVLRNKFGVQLFQEFLRSQYGEENLNFWLAVEEYKKLDESSRAERARMIYEDYVSTLSPTEVR